MKLKPLHNNVVIEAMRKETKSGIIIPDTVDKEKPQKGIVIDIGGGGISENGSIIKMTVKKGDIVIFKEYSPDEISIDGKEYLIIKENDILAIIE